MSSQLQSQDVGLRDFAINLTAGKESKLPVQGDYVLLYSATAALVVKPNGQNDTTIMTGDGLPVGEYGYLVVVSQIDQAVIVKYGYVPIGQPTTRSQLTAGAFTVTNNVGANLGNGSRVTIAAGASSELFPASTTRLGWRAAFPSAADGLRVGGPGVSATTGLPIPFGATGMTETISPRGAAHIYNGTANPVTFDRFEELP